MTELAQPEIGNATRREFLAQLRALGGLVLVASLSGTSKASDAPKYGADGMPHGSKDDPHVFVAIGTDGTVTIVVRKWVRGFAQVCRSSSLTSWRRIGARCA
jgi:isoquinoline 1-oxidoreductase subunit beta